MATIITKNSQTASAVPAAASLAVGELAVNTADGKLYTEHTGGVVKEIIPSTVVDGGITANKLASNAVTTAKIADANVTVAKLSATGTPSSSTFLRGDGAWQAAGGGGGRGQSFTSNGTFTIPTGVTALKVTVVGGGGGGGTCNIACSSGSSGGGGGGGASIKYLTSLTPGNTLSVTIGGGGGSATSGGNSSVASGTQSITTITGNGGSAGQTTNDNTFANGGSGGSGSGGDFICNGNGGGSAAGQYRMRTHGGSSIFGGGAPGAALTGSGTNATNYGGGGGGAGNIEITTRPGGSGSQGIVVFEW